MTELSVLHETGVVLCSMAEVDDIPGVRQGIRCLSPLRLRLVARIMGCLADRRPGAGRVLEELLRNPDDGVRAEAYDALGRCPKHILVSVGECLSRTREPEPWVEVSRIRALSCVAAHLPAAVADALEGAAATTHTWVQHEVVRALDACLASGEDDVLQCVERWFRNRAPDVRETALLWMATIETGPPSCLVPAAVRLATDGSPRVRAAAARVLSVHGMRSPEETIPLLAELALDRSHHRSRMEVVRGLEKWQSSAPFEALMILKGLLEDPVNAVRCVALRRLYRLSREHPSIAWAVVREWHAARHVRRAAVTTCLRAVVRSHDAVVAVRAHELLSRIMRRSA